MCSCQTVDEVAVDSIVAVVCGEELSGDDEGDEDDEDIPDIDDTEDEDDEEDAEVKPRKGMSRTVAATAAADDDNESEEEEDENSEEVGVEGKADLMLDSGEALTRVLLGLEDEDGPQDEAAVAEAQAALHACSQAGARPHQSHAA